jgi:hypothetical protein
MGARCTGGHIFLDEGADLQPSVFAADKVYSLVLSKVTRERVVMLITQDPESEVIGARDINAVVQP